MAERIYQALRRWTQWLKYSLIGWIALSLVEALPRLALLLQAAGVSIDAGPAAGQESLAMVVGFESLFMLSAAMAFAFWIYRANANLHAFGIEDIASPGWAVGSFVIPIAFLWLGYGVMRDVWNKSGPPDSLLDGKGWLLPVWWGGWIVTSLLSPFQTLFRGSLDFIALTALQFSEPAANIVAGVALIAIITKIDIAQQQQESFEVF